MSKRRRAQPIDLHENVHEGRRDTQRFFSVSFVEKKIGGMAMYTVNEIFDPHTLADDLGGVRRIYTEFFAKLDGVDAKP